MVFWFVTHFLMVIMVTTATASPESLLPPCPASPNCVSSLAVESRFIAPLGFTGPPEAALARLKALVAERSDATIISSDQVSFRVEFRTLLGFVDDGLFVLDAAAGMIQWRSAARSGYWDLGKNRRRLEEIRRQFSSS